MAPKWRGQGTGRALMEAAEAWARARGYREISTPSWRKPRRGT
ncbi:GNAT family N-acetyltransferase [Thermus tengchongensis]|nr:GNAT family N-acetyltransferase [Thermus tengchongensis]